MLKKFLITLFIFSGMAAFAQENFLNSVVIDTTNNKTSIILRSDKTAKLRKKIEASDRITLTLSGIAQSSDINTLYKNTVDVKGLAIQNDGNNGLKIYIQAPDIAKANIIFETPDSAPVPVTNDMSESRMIWIVSSILLLLMIMRSARNVKPKFEPDINDIIKEREKALYRNFQRDVATMPSINYKPKSYNRQIRKGETLRYYEQKSTLLR